MTLHDMIAGTAGHLGRMVDLARRTRAQDELALRRGWPTSADMSRRWHEQQKREAERTRGQMLEASRG